MKKESQYPHTNEKLRYQKNILSYGLCLLALILNIITLGVLFGYPPVLNPDLRNGFDIIAHILFLLTTFLTAEKLKVYSARWAYVGMGMGVFEVLKIFVFVLPYYKHGLMSAGVLTLNIVLLIVICLLLVAAGLICMYKAKILKGLKASEVEHG